MSLLGQLIRVFPYSWRDRIEDFIDFVYCIFHRCAKLK